jgi:hypothetical protein
MTFTELAWGAFIYRALGSDREYMEIITHVDFLRRLRLHPKDISATEFKETVKLFLNRWRCRVSDDVCARLLRSLQATGEMIGSLRNRNLTTLTEDDIARAGIVFGCLIENIGVKAAIAAKTLHIVNPLVFVPVDNPILARLGDETNGVINNTQSGYASFIRLAQQHAIDVTADFNRRGLHGSPAIYLSEKLGYAPHKTLAKYVDEYFWVTRTNEFSIPPLWDPSELE